MGNLGFRDPVFLCIAFHYLTPKTGIAFHGNNERICNEKKTLHLFLSLLVEHLDGGADLLNAPCLLFF
ncbi:MAG TPA: hypothetical protein DCE71_02230 [Parachlamydiales bacterium]|nr:hypothetical protein [Parachlamydiales bacterium]